MIKYCVLAFTALVLCGCGRGNEKVNIDETAASEVQQYLNSYNVKYTELYKQSSEAEWLSNIKIIPGDSSNAVATRKAKEALAMFAGSSYNIAQTKKYLGMKEKLSPLQVRQLEKILYNAANSPDTVIQLVEERIKAETEQTEKLYGFRYELNGKKISTNYIDSILAATDDLGLRLAAWQESKEVGKSLREGLVQLQALRNKTVQALGYHDYFTYQVSDYGMSTDEMMAYLKKITGEIWPLYRELHTWARYELAKKYHARAVPGFIPAQWLPNRWGQGWEGMIEVKGLNLDSILNAKTKEWIIQQGERFYVSLGFDSLPGTFWKKSDLYPLPADAAYSKNNHASAWHMDLGKDVRSLMSIVPNAEWYETSHHELGHIYYYMTYANPDVPPVLREGANRAYHEALGSLMGLAAMQKPFLANLNLLPVDSKTDDMKILLKEALNYIVFIPWSAGVMSEFEYSLYSENLPAERFNSKWWELVKKYQGIVPPSERGEEYCDAATKTHINDDAGQYYDYALSYILLFQVHDYISKNILHQDPHATNYYGSREIGNFLKSIMYPGASLDWRAVLKEKTGNDLSAAAMLEYFNPLLEYLKKENTGRQYTLPEKFE